MILTIVGFGKYLEGLSKDKTESVTKKLKKLSPEKATVIIDGNEVIIDVSLVKEGDIVEITEGELPSNWYYTIEPAVAMSGNIPLFERLMAREGKVVKVEARIVGFTVTVEFNED